MKLHIVDLKIIKYQKKFRIAQMVKPLAVTCMDTIVYLVSGSVSKKYNGKNFPILHNVTVSCV